MISAEILKHLNELDDLKGDGHRPETIWMRWLVSGIELLLRAELTRQNGARYKSELPEKTAKGGHRG